jgi:hypothetical protein
MNTKAVSIVVVPTVSLSPALPFRAPSLSEVDDLVPMFSVVSFKRIESITVVCYNDLDTKYELHRPVNFETLISMLTYRKLYQAGDGLCYFPDNKVEHWAENRVRLTPETFRAWTAYEKTDVRLPHIIVYPKLDGKSPEKPPLVASPDVSLAASTGSQSSTTSTSGRRQDYFRQALLEADRNIKTCIVPGCTVLLGDAEAAHILPHRMKNGQSALHNTILQWRS